MPAISDAKPNINVTPMIDILLVLLVIFMVVAPLKPTAFKAKVPAEPTKDPGVKDDPRTLVVVINHDLSLALNTERNVGTIDDPARLQTRLADVFRERQQNGESAKMVFVKAPRSMPYGEIVKVVDAIKVAGASPIALQIDNLGI